MVTEPNPASTVSMTRGGVPQTRTFTYSGTFFNSTANTENGTVSYTYDGAHHVLSRTDAIGSQTQYSYDSYGRLTEVQYYPASNGGNEDTSQRVTYYYDGNLPSGCAPLTTLSTQNATGRLTGAGFGGGMSDAYKDSYCYFYAYNQAGRVITQEMQVKSDQYHYNNVSFSASYQ